MLGFRRRITSFRNFVRSLTANPQPPRLYSFLPDEIWLKILPYLGLRDLVTVSRVNFQLYMLTQEKDLFDRAICNFQVPGPLLPLDKQVLPKMEEFFVKYLVEYATLKNISYQGRYKELRHTVADIRNGKEINNHSEALNKVAQLTNKILKLSPESMLPMQKRVLKNLFLYARNEILVSEETADPKPTQHSPTVICRQLAFKTRNLPKYERYRELAGYCAIGLLLTWLPWLIIALKIDQPAKGYFKILGVLWILLAFAAAVYHIYCENRAGACSKEILLRTTGRKEIFPSPGDEEKIVALIIKRDIQLEEQQKGNNKKNRNPPRAINIAERVEAFMATLRKRPTLKSNQDEPDLEKGDDEQKTMEYS